ncbi:MAG: pyridoxal phosphate-dependent aminotransferase [Bacteroidota bacterium]
MSVSRLTHITPIGVEQMGDLADQLQNPEVLRLENLDTDFPPPAHALEATRQAVGKDEANSYLPFLGSNALRAAATELLRSQTGIAYDWKTECVISAGGLSGILNVLLATLEPGDEVLMTDPIYAGLLNRVRLAGGVPRLVPLNPTPDGWRLDLEALAQVDPARVKVALMMSPSMPTGAVLNAAEWKAIADFCQRADAWLLNDTAMERLLFDGREVLHPAVLPGMRDRTISVGAASKEYRMIGWRIGWVVGPAQVIADVARVGISNVVCLSGIGMAGAEAALAHPQDGISEFCAELQARRDLLLHELADYRLITPHGGWSLLMDVSPLGMNGAEAAQRLLERGKIAATPMTNWGSESASAYVRLVFSNEPLDRLGGIEERVRRSLGS